MKWLLTFLIALPAFGAQIFYEEGRLQAPKGTRLAVLDREDCKPYSLKSPTLRLPKNCLYLSGELKTSSQTQNFAVTRDGKNYGLIVFAATR